MSKVSRKSQHDLASGSNQDKTRDFRSPLALNPRCPEIP
ncbi:hypothetical protein SynROS8604_00408 [Synechococcus sp. ROS8604]|nr:hypothetical protein SynROS8604_00408 [Synechococcus sp. ROS8604]